MNEAMKDKFDNFFRDYNQNKIDIKSGFMEKELRRQEFMKSFEDMIMKNIVPVMTEIGHHLEENGHGSLIGNHFEHQAIFMNIFLHQIHLNFLTHVLSKRGTHFVGHIWQDSLSENLQPLN